MIKLDTRPAIRSSRTVRPAVTNPRISDLTPASTIIDTLASKVRPGQRKRTPRRRSWRPLPLPIDKWIYISGRAAAKRATTQTHVTRTHDTSPPFLESPPPTWRLSPPYPESMDSPNTAARHNRRGSGAFDIDRPYCGHQSALSPLGSRHCPTRPGLPAIAAAARHRLHQHSPTGGGRKWHEMHSSKP